MKRKLIAALCITGALFAGTAIAADHEVVGFLSLRGIMNNYGSSTGAGTILSAEDNSSAWVQERFRGKWTINVNEYVQAVYYGEIDMTWGDANYNVGRNAGAGPGADSINLETKNLYMAVKVPDTPVAFKAGVFGVGDHWNGLFLLSDVAGLMFTGDYAGAKIGAGWFKLWEGATDSMDDCDLWALMVGMSPADNLKINFDLFFANDWGASFNAGDSNRGNLGGSLEGDYERAQLYWLGMDATYKADALTFWGFFAYNFGTVDNAGYNTGAGQDVDVAGFALDAKVTYAMPGLTLGFEGWYVSGDDDATDGDFDSFLSTDIFSGTGGGTASTDLPLYKSGLIILGTDPYSDNFRASTLAVHYNQGLGMLGGVLTANYVPAEKTYVKAALGYMAAAEDNPDGDGDVLGTEINARVGYKMADNFDLSLNGAYVFTGDFLEGLTALGGEDAEDLWIAYLMARATF